MAAIGKLYLPDAEDRESYGETNIYVGTKNNIQIDLDNLESKNGFTANYFWLRSPDQTYEYNSLVAKPGFIVSFDSVDSQRAVVPAFNLDLSSLHLLRM